MCLPKSWLRKATEMSQCRAVRKSEGPNEVAAGKPASPSRLEIGNQFGIKTPFQFCASFPSPVPLPQHEVCFL